MQLLQDCVGGHWYRETSSELGTGLLDGRDESGPAALGDPSIDDGCQLGLFVKFKLFNGVQGVGERGLGRDSFHS
jgi:hypothetical protein